jgi:hypothetical protein
MGEALTWQLLLGPVKALSGAEFNANPTKMSHAAILSRTAGKRQMSADSRTVLWI